MDSGYYAVATALAARSQALDTAANNLANVNTNGFRAERDYFASTLMSTRQQASQAGTALNTFAMLGGDRIDLSQGELTATGSPTDVAVQGPGFLQVQTEHGVRYTRDGALERGAGGTLQTLHGDAVLGADGKPILAPGVDISIAEDGTVSSGGGVVGKVALVMPSSAGALQPEGAGLYRADAEAMSPATGAVLRSGHLESSNLNPVAGTAQLLLVQRQTEMMQRVLTMFHNDFGRTAAEELPKV